MLPVTSEDYRDEAIRRMSTEMEEKRQILLANNLKLLVNRSSEVREVGRDAVPRDGSKGKRAISHHDAVESHGNSRVVASGERKGPTS